ncbi:MAG: hypothetical protein LDL26_06450 [Caenispirillum bisanense]|nr:hypothetical protein [Caenispirillum bisanense]MCA1973077.1 hypothetical protein [Caenispirillum sp.]
MEKRRTPDGSEQVRETPEEARQAQKGRPVAMVLMGALTLGLIALIALMIWALSGEPEPTSQEQQQGAAPTAITAPPA